MGMNVFYVFELTDLPGGIPFAKTTDQGIAAFVFRTASNALKYAEAKEHGNDWRVRELNVFDALDWIRDAQQSNGVTAVWLNPDPNEEGHQEIPVALFLSILESQCRE